MKTLIPHDFVTHKDAWRAALLLAIHVSEHSGNSDDVLYWAHELEAYDYAHDILDILNVELIP